MLMYFRLWLVCDVLILAQLIHVLATLYNFDIGSFFFEPVSGHSYFCFRFFYPPKENFPKETLRGVPLV